MRKSGSLSPEAVVALNGSSRKALLGRKTLCCRGAVVPNSWYCDCISQGARERERERERERFVSRD